MQSISYSNAFLKEAIVFSGAIPEAPRCAVLIKFIIFLL